MALAAAQGIHAATGFRVGLKWPNDLIVGNRKLGGVLVETAYRGGEVAEAVLSLGLNVNLAKEDLPETATSLREVTGREHSLETIAARTLESLERGWPALRGDGAALCDEWSQWDALGKTEVVVEIGGEKQRGEAQGIDAFGALVLLVSGERRHLQVGEIHRVRRL